MIVCHCNVISRHEIEQIVDRLRENDPYCVITPGRIYHRLGKRGRCCNCFPLVVQILVERIEGSHGDDPAAVSAEPRAAYSDVA